ncbi:SdpI family protein [Phenylobacterium sp.]|uniref:SdpI family protein n=1 Tax=Phenylobacterium sp. TaxID=1871053 RepID=UPI0035ADDFA0
MKLSRTDIGAAAVFAAQFAAAGYVAKFGSSAPIPLHFDVRGHADRWGDRAEQAGFMAAMTAVMALVYLAVRRSSAKGGQTTDDASVLVLALSSIISAMGAALGTGALSGSSALNAPAFHTGLLALLMLVIGVFLGKVSPNPWVGVRTFWTANSRLAWDKANRLAGRFYFWAGLGGLMIAPFTPQPAGMGVVIGAMILGAILAVIESWRVWKTDPDRG